MTTPTTEKTTAEDFKDEWVRARRAGETLESIGARSGYSAERVRDRQKIARNLRLLERAVREAPEDPNLFMNYGLELIHDGQLEAGLEQYREAFRLLSAQRVVVPELREALLTQFATHLMAAKRFNDIIDLLRTPLARLALMATWGGQSFQLRLRWQVPIEPGHIAILLNHPPDVVIADA